MFVTFEGVDGSGKSTQAELLRVALEREGREVVAVREPGGTPLGEEVRRLLLHGSDISAWAEAALFAAARAELVDRIVAPALERGADVVCDRYVDSSLAYQGLARGLGVDPVLDLNLTAVRGLMPDRTFVLLVDPEAARARLPRELDRIEREDAPFRARVHDAYRQLVALFPDRLVAVDGMLPPDEIAGLIRDELRALA